MSAQTFTLYPPAPAPINVRFDKHQFQFKTASPVAVRYMGKDEWESTGLSFGDYNFCQTQQRKGGRGDRRLPTPIWAMNDRLLRSVCIRYLEIRVALFGKQPGTEAERLARVTERLKERTESQMAALDGLCSEYVVSTDVARRELLEQEISNLDTTIRIAREPWMIPAIVKAYYRERCDSVECGARFGLKPPHIRQLLYRLNQLYKSMLERKDVHAPTDAYVVGH